MSATESSPDGHTALLNGAVAQTPSDRPLLWHSAVTSAGLSLLFLVVYNATNWLASQRATVGSCYFDWELAIPFVPIFIIPYMSIDLFFVAAPFLCRERTELRTLAWRITLAVALAGICFGVWPLRLGFERPHVEGWLGAIFNPFIAVDHPFNLVPSLHIALRTILADLYARRFSGLLRIASHIWFSLIGFSTVLTHQHHLVDVLGGFVLAVLCFYVVRTNVARLPVVSNHRIGIYYGSAALLLLAAVVLAWPWGSIIVWPVVALGITASAYWGVGPRIFRKVAGVLPLSSQLVLGPLLLGQRLSLEYYRRQCRPWDEVVPGVWIGRKLSGIEATGAVAQGVTAVLDLTTEFSETKPFRQIRYLNLPVLDLTAPTQDQLHSAAQFIAVEAKRGIAYVHCKIGYSRSAAAVGAYLISSRTVASADEAVALIRKARPSLIVRPEAFQALRVFAQQAANARSAVSA